MIDVNTTRFLLIITLTLIPNLVIGTPVDSSNSIWPKVTFNIFETGTLPSNDGVKVINAYLASKYPGESTIVEYPLKRVFNHLKHLENHCAFGVTPHEDYVALRPVLKMTYRIYRLRETKTFENRDKQASITTINTFAHERLARKFTPSPILINSRTKIIEMLTSKRVEYILELDLVVETLLDNMSNSPIVEDVIVDKALFFFSCSNKTEQIVLDWFTNLWDQGRESKTIDRMYESRGFSALLP